MKKNLLLFLIIISCSLSYTFAGTTGKITGKVTDSKTKEALPFVNVIVEGTNLGAATDIDGNYVILNVPPGKYNIRAQYIGYQTVLVENIEVNIDLTTTVDFELSESTVNLQEVVIQGAQDLIKKDVTSSQSLITSDQIQTLPVAEFNDVLQLQAGVTRDANGDFHIRGGRTNEISYWVNGISVTDAYDHSRGIQIDNNSIQELQVISGVVHGAGDHDTALPVRLRDEMLRLVLAKVAASSVASPWIKSDVASDWLSSVVNWMCALEIVAPGGMSSPLKRRPTVWSLPS